MKMLTAVINAPTNMIAYHIRPAEISKRVICYKVTVDGDYATACGLIRRVMSPIALARMTGEKNGQVFGVMRLRERGPFEENLEQEPGARNRLAIREVDPREIARALPRLCQRAAPKMVECDVAVGMDTKLYFPFPHKKTGGKNGYVITWSPEIFTETKEGQPLQYPYMGIQIVSWRAASTIDETYRETEMAKREQMTFSEDVFHRAVKGQKSGEIYLKGTVTKGNMRHGQGALDVGSESLPAFLETRAGFFWQMQDMIDRAWGGGFSIRFQSFEGQLARISSEAIKKNVEERLGGSRRTLTAYVDPSAEQGDWLLSALAEACASWNVEITPGADLEAADLVILMPQDHYKNAKTEDPYEVIARRPSSQVITCRDDLLKLRDKPRDAWKAPEKKLFQSMVDVVLIELVVKEEVRTGRLIHHDHQEHAPFTAIWKSKELVHGDALVADVRGGALSMRSLNAAQLAAEFPHAISEHTVIIEDVAVQIHGGGGLHGLPDVRRVQAQLASLAGDGDPDEPSISPRALNEAAEASGMDPKVLEGLLDYVSRKELQEMFPSSQAAKSRKPNKRSTDEKANKALKAALEDVGGNAPIRLASGLRAQTGPNAHAEALGAFPGLFVSKGRDLYMVGQAGNMGATFERFPSLRRVTATGPVPDAFFELLKDLTIRHKQLTVLPFIFKHMREKNKADIIAARGPSLEELFG